MSNARYCTPSEIERMKRRDAHARDAWKRHDAGEITNQQLADTLDWLHDLPVLDDEPRVP